MKLPDILLLGLTIAFLIIGADQSITYGFQSSYWAFMLALTFFFVFNYRRNRKPQDGPPQDPKPRKRTAQK